MKKYSLVFIIAFLFGTNQTFAQIKSGRILYQVSMQDFYDGGVKGKKVSPHLDRVYKMTADAAKNIQLELFFNQETSVFQHQRGLSISDFEGMDDFVKYLTAKGTYFTNLDYRKQILQTEYQDNKYNVASEIEKQDWTLTKEQKRIGAFVCYKAILDKSNTGLNEDTIAWYAPEIPFSYGPTEHVGNLPGLILELELPIATYTASKVELNPKKEVKIDWPNNIETITEEEYKKEGDKALSKLGRGW
jgi:GLPGLI family protein